MNSQDNIPVSATDSVKSGTPDQPRQEQTQSVGETSETPTAQDIANPAEPGRWCTLAICSIVVTVIAWIAANLNGYVAMVAAAVGILLGAMALKSHRHGVRNTAITSIIAAAVLLVVLAAFMIVIYLGLKSL